MGGLNFNNVPFVGSLGRATGPGTPTARPIPIIYRASSLTPGAGISSWRNQGVTGAVHDLKLRFSGAAPTYQPASGSIPASVRMTDVSFESLGLLPSSFSGDENRTIGICSLMESPDFLNLLGYGTATNQQLYDVLTYGDNYLFPHYYGAETYVGPRNQTGVFQVVIVRSTVVAGGTPTTDFFSSNGLVNTQTSGYPLHTAPNTPLFIGSGVFNSYNRATPRRISGVFMADYAMTDLEIQAATPLLTT